MGDDTPDPDAELPALRSVAYEEGWVQQNADGSETDTLQKFVVEPIGDDGTLWDSVPAGSELLVGTDGESMTLTNPDGSFRESRGYDGATRFVDPDTGVTTVHLPDGTWVTIAVDGSSTIHSSDGSTYSQGPH